MRAVGDTKRPMLYLMISGLVNVALNLLLVIVFHMDVAGVAIATVASQVVSMVLVLLCLFRTRGVTQLNLHECRIDRKSLREIIRIGLPAGLQGSLFSISNVMIQSSVNSFGSLVVAGNGVASNIEGFVYTAMNAQHQADMTFASQNYGAGKPERVRRTLWCCLGVVTAIGLGMGLLMLLFGRTLMGLYNPEEQVISCGMIRMGIIMPTYFLCGLMDVMVGQLRGIGYSLLTKKDTPATGEAKERKREAVQQELFADEPKPKVQDFVAGEGSDLWARLLDLLDRHDVTFVWIKGHAENAFNNRCDAMAVAERPPPCTSTLRPGNAAKSRNRAASEDSSSTILPPTLIIFSCSFMELQSYK